MSLKQLYPQQKEAYDWVFRFLNDPNTIEATLCGAAGTGKTFLVQAIMNNLKIRACITAPVHKALRVLEATVNRQGMTFHALHGLRPNLDLTSFDLDNLQFDTIGDPKVKYFKLIVCDECSQIGETLYNLNLSRAKQFNYKILYIGDDCQLPPVSKNKKKPEKQSMTFSIKNKFKLTEIVRQEKGNPLLEPFALLRDDIANKTYNFTKHIFDNRNTITEGVGYAIQKSADFVKTLKDVYTSIDFKADVSYCRHISYTNDSVAFWNGIIRKFIYPKTHNIMLLPDDVLMAYKTVVNEFNDTLFINSETYVVEHIREYIDEYELKMFAVNLIDRDSGLPTPTLQIVNHTDTATMYRYHSILSALHLRAKQAHASERDRKWKEFFKFKEKKLCMVSFRLGEKNNYQPISKDFDYGYAITAHKAQGSTFTRGTMDLGNMLYFRDNITAKYKRRADTLLVNKLIYVGITRVKNSVHMYL